MNRLLHLIIPLLLIAGCQKQPPQPQWNLTQIAPAQLWEERFPLGNGHLGMMPDGGVEEVGSHWCQYSAKLSTPSPSGSRVSSASARFVRVHRSQQSGIPSPSVSAGS